MIITLVILILIFAIFFLADYFFNSKMKREYFENNQNSDDKYKGYYINHPDAHDRHEKLQTHLKSFGLESSIQRHLVDLKTEPKVTDSHKNILRKAIQQNLPYVLILEDDVEFKEDPRPYIDSAFEKLNGDWDILLLGANLKRANVEYNKSLNLGRLKGGYCAGCHSYMVNNRYFKTLLDNMQNENEGGACIETMYKGKNTNMMNLCKQDKWYFVNPLLGIQNDEYSFQYKKIEKKKDGRFDNEFFTNRNKSDFPVKINNTEFYFIHIPKNAGTSFIKTYCNDKQSGHHKASEISDNELLKKTVAIIRNPYERLYSIYVYTKKDNSYWHGKGKKYDMLPLYKYCKTHTFKEFVNDLSTKKIKLSDQIHLIPQTDFLKARDGEIYTKLVRFKYLEEDLSNILQIGVSLPKINQSLYGFNINKHYDSDMKQKIYQLYKDDFSLFDKLNNLENGNLLTETFQNKETYHFIHIPKNGGSSMVNILKNSSIPITYIGHNYLNINENEIIILRDPIDRFISAFYYRIQNLNHISNPTKYKIANDKFKTVNQFIESLTDKTSKNYNYAKLIFENQENNTVNNNLIKTRWIFSEQTSWINNPKFILRFSHLEEDFNKCLKDIGHNKYVSLPKKNSSVHKDKNLSKNSLAFLKEFYKKDFELLESNPFTYGNLTEGFENQDNSGKLIDGVLYINLAHRTDRKEHIENELQKIVPICGNIQRINAVKHQNGGKGCGLSHIKALEYAKQHNFKNTLIVEDDLIFKPNYNPVTYLKNTLDSLNNQFDILMLSGNPYKLKHLNRRNLAKPINVQTTSCYLINSHYYDKLISVFRESCDNLLDKKERANYHRWAIDRNWFKLQEKDNWFIFNPTIGYQIEDYSDIEGTVVDYKK
jgi:glycosyl transferase, family 25